MLTARCAARDAHCVARRNDMTMPKNILLGTDFSACGDDALKYAFALATCLGAKVHLLHVFTLRDMLEATSPEHEAVVDPDAWAERKLHEVAAPYQSSGLVGELIVTMGKPASALLETTARLGPDLIMLGGRTRRGLTRRAIGDVGPRVLRDVPCPVMVLRHPAGKSRMQWHRAS
jgi:nucleotide-binding universal stress UspA family protein